MYRIRCKIMRISGSRSTCVSIWCRPLFALQLGLFDLHVRIGLHVLHGKMTVTRVRIVESLV
jgi:hypothetical protein